MHPDPNDSHAIVSFITRNLDMIVTGLVVILLTLIRFLGRKDVAEAATNIVKEKPVTHEEVELKMLRCQMEVREHFSDMLNEFRKELLAEIGRLHVRLNKEERNGR